MKILSLCLCLSLTFAQPINIESVDLAKEEVSSAVLKYVSSKLASLKTKRPLPKQVKFDIPSEVALAHVDQKSGKVTFVVPSKKGGTKVPGKVLEYLSPLSYPIKVVYNLNSEDAKSLNHAFQNLQIEKKVLPRNSKPISSTTIIKPILKANTLPFAEKLEKDMQYEFYYSLKKAFGKGGRWKRKSDFSDDAAKWDIDILGKYLDFKYESGKVFSKEEEGLLQSILAKNGYYSDREIEIK